MFGKPNGNVITESMRGDRICTAPAQYGNFIFSFGCQPGQGVKGDSKYIKDFINLITSNFNEKGAVLLPDVFSRVVSSDA